MHRTLSQPALRNQNAATNPSGAADKQQQGGGSSGFKVSFANHPRKATATLAEAAAGCRRDIDMRPQLADSIQREALYHQQWVETHEANVTRLPGEQEKHYLKILIRSAVLRQRDEGSTHLSSVILSRSNPNNTTKKKKIVTKEEAFDLDFVVKKLMEDIDIVYRRHGYKTTLQAFADLRPWQL